MKNKRTTVESLAHWVYIIDRIRTFSPKYAQYFAENLLIDGKKDRMVYLGNIEAFADILESLLSKVD